MISRSGVTALNGFLEAVFSPDVSSKPIIFQIPPTQAESGTTHGSSLHFSVTARPGRVAHLVLRADIRNGQPVLLGCLFDGDPVTANRQAEEWLQNPNFECGGNDVGFDVGGELSRQPGKAFHDESRRSINDYLAHVEEIERALSDRKINLPGNSRLAEYRKALEAFRLRRFDSVVGPAMQAVYEVRQLAIIFEELSSILSDRQLRDLASGHFSPHTESKQSKTLARDIQFELFVAAVCRRGGLSVGLAEPDVLVGLNGQRVAIAAKRIKSTKRLTQNFKDANRQIHRLDDPDAIGCVIMDLTPIYNPTQHYLRVHSSYEAEEIIGSRVRRFIQRNEQAMMSLAGPRICAVLAHASVSAIWVGQEFGTVTSVVGVGTCTAGDPRRDTMTEVVRAFTRGTEGL